MCPVTMLKGFSFNPRSRIKVFVVAIAAWICTGGEFFVRAAHADLIFHDDFSDGDFEDGSPVTWERMNEAHFSASTGDLVVHPANDNGGILSIAEIDLRDVSLRLQARMDPVTVPAVLEFSARADRTIGEGVIGRLSICPNDIRASIRQDGGLWWCTENDWVEVDVDPVADDIAMQLDTFDSTAALWVWNADEPKPEEPTLTMDITFGPGEVGVVYDELSVDGFGIFRYVRLEDMPIEDWPGDFNFDFQLNATDMDVLSHEILKSQPREWFDLNGDMVVDDGDRRFWVESLANTFFGDADLNGTVDFTDFLALSSSFGQPGGWAQGDFDGSGDVAFPDFLLLSSNFGSALQATATQSVPEPTPSILTLAGSLWILSRRKRRVTLGQ